MKEGETVRTHCLRCGLLLPMGQRKWCNRECQHDRKPKDPCPICGKNIPKEGRRRKFCSQKCYWKACDRKKVEHAAINERQCSLCRRILPVEDFLGDKTKIGGIGYRCWRCGLAQQKVNRSGQTYDDKRRDTYYKNTYGITLEDYNKLIDFQNGVCAVCQNPPKGKRLAIDHSHRDGLVRGALCVNCNLRVIGKHVDPEILYRAARYLESPPLTEMFGRDVVAPSRPKKKRQPRKRPRK